jgi:hypothetical protein
MNVESSRVACGGAQRLSRTPSIHSGETADGTGEGEFSPIYAPQRAGGEGGPELFLEPDNSDVPLQDGEFTENPRGQALVPYNQVFSDYSNAANRALESDYIPLGLRDVVHDYFTSLEPGQRP